ncbi:MAG: lipopolysaccharide transport periplasmic protein LptA [Gammaproteobacteria bacterium]|nr:lipopolysaccharide transport periplasmic protein LptA [Gammaproteobacteria bacterium]
MLSKKCHKRLLKSTTHGLLLLTIATPLLVAALNTDNNQSMQINAGKLVIDEQQGTSIYSGTVTITQGSRIISGESITIFSKTDEITKIIIKGQPASFSQLNDKNETIKASGNEMIFYNGKDLLILKENAELQQKDNVFRSAEITYNTAKDVITAGNDDNAQDERVKITIHPNDESQTAE